VLFEMQSPESTTAGTPHDGSWALLEKHDYELFAVGDDGVQVPISAPRVGNNLAFPKRPTE
jgi:hypothetical protein